MHSGADEIVKTLKEAGVDMVFGIPSIHNIRLYEALREEPSIKHILCRQETTGTMMADGYARAGHRLGVMLSSTGPGSGYTIPALQEAWGSCSPVLLITTNIPAKKIGKGLGSLHELDDQDALFRKITKATVSIRPGDNIQVMTQRAIDLALSQRPGPVYLEVPTDLLDKSISKAGHRETKETDQLEIFSDIEKALTLLHHAKQPILLVGTEAVRAGIHEDIRILAEALGAPVITTANAKGIISEDHPLAIGNAARRGVIREIVQSCDVALAIGTRLREVDAKRRGLILPQLIHIDWDGQWVGKNFPTDVALMGEIPTIVKVLLDKLEPGSLVDQRLLWIKEMNKKIEQELSGIREAQVEVQYVETIRKALPRDSIFVIDNTQLGYWAEYFYPSYCPGGLITAKGSSIIGYAFAAAIGAKMACPEKPVLALIGDGGFLYSTQELATCSRYKVGFPVVVVNDSAYGIIAYLQRNAFEKEYESRLDNPDMVALARAYGARATRVESLTDLEASIKEAFASDELWIIELVGSFPEPPFGRY